MCVLCGAYPIPQLYKPHSSKSRRIIIKRETEKQPKRTKNVCKIGKTHSINVINGVSLNMNIEEQKVYTSTRADTHFVSVYALVELTKRALTHFEK